MSLVDQFIKYFLISEFILFIIAVIYVFASKPAKGFNIFCVGSIFLIILALFVGSV